jgi:hypothetical protein
MSEKKAYPLRISTPVLEAIQRWADDDLRSLNAQIEYVLREALRQQGRLKKADEPPAVPDDETEAGP